MSEPSESVLLQAIRNAYGLDARRVITVRSVHKVITTKGAYCLKGFGSNDWGNFVLVHDMTNYLWGRGYARIPRVVDTVFGNPVLALDGGDYVLTTWQDARETDLDNPKHLKAAARGLAELHQASVGFEIQTRHAGFNRLGTWFADIENSLAELRSWCDFVLRRGASTELDRTLLSESPRMARLCEQALVQLAHTDYDGLLRAASESGVYCHNSLYYQNILIDRRGSAHFVDLDKSILDLRTRDLAMLIMRRLKQVDWRPEEAFLILDSYQCVAPLTAQDLSALYCRLLFPERLMKRFRAHYGPKRKSVASVYKRTMSLLEREGAHDEFLASFPVRVYQIYGATIS